MPMKVEARCGKDSGAGSTSTTRAVLTPVWTTGPRMRHIGKNPGPATLARLSNWRHNHEGFPPYSRRQPVLMTGATLKSHPPTKPTSPSCPNCSGRTIKSSLPMPDTPATNTNAAQGRWGSAGACRTNASPVMTSRRVSANVTASNPRSERGRTCVSGDQATVWFHQDPLPRAGEEQGPGQHVGGLGKFVSATRAADGHLRGSVRPPCPGDGRKRRNSGRKRRNDAFWVRALLKK